MTNKEIGLAPYHIPTVLAGEYNITAELNQKNNVDESTVLNEGKKQEIKFRVAGYNTTIPQNEILAVYPPIDHTGDFAGTFPHIQFRRSTLPWEYKVNTSTKVEDRLPYIYLVLFKEEELKDFEISPTDTNSLAGSIESPDEPKPLKLITCNNSELFPKPNLNQKLAHVRVQEHTELKDLNLPKETSILVSHRMVQPEKKYRAFVCYYAKLNAKAEYEMITDLTDNSVLEFAIILNEWSFESSGVELYQVNKKKLDNYPHKDKLPNGIENSEIVPLDLNKLETLTDEFKPFKSLINENIEYRKCLIKIELKFISEFKTLPETTPPTQSISGSKIKEWLESNASIFKETTKVIDKTKSYTINELQKVLESDNNHILEYLQYNGKNLKGYFHELELQPFKTFLKKKISDERLEDYPSHIKSLLDISKVPLEHQLKAGGKMVSWYQGPFTNNSNNFDLLQFLADQKIETIPDHQDYLNLFNEDTGMYDMTYSAAWQLGRLMIMNDNKMLQELKKWKYDLELYNLILEQNKLSHLPNLSIQESSIPDVLMNYVTELIQFRNFPLYYLLPHADLSTEESIKHFKIDNSWILAFLFGIFSAGPKLSTKDFKYYLFEKPKKDFEDTWNKLSVENIDKSKLIKILYKSLETDKTNTAKKNVEFVNECRNKIEDNTCLNHITDLILKLKNEMWYVFNTEQDYNGILLQSQTIKNWPHIVVELNGSHDFHYLTSINNSLRLYITDQKIESIELYLKNEDAHFGKEYKSNDNQFITPCKDSVTTANNNLYKQPRVVFNIKSKKTNAESEKRVE